MSSRNVNTILSLLPNLSPAEALQVAHGIRALSGISGGEVTPPSSPKESSDVDLVVEVIAKTLSDLGVEQTSPTNLKAGAQFASFRKKVPDLIDYLKQGGLQSRLEYRAVIGLGVELLYLQLNKMSLPVSSRMVMQQVHRIPSILNQHFPGYASNKTLGWLVRK